MTTFASHGLHALLLLSDSALPLGSFAFSSGLESYLAHHKQHTTTPGAKLLAFENFLEDSLSNVASTALPYVRAGYHNSRELEDLDNDFDASTPCTVARRASISQGRALMTLWDRALKSSVVPGTEGQAAARALDGFAVALKDHRRVDVFGLRLNAHFAPLFGVICCALGLPLAETTYLFLLNHAKALLSAAVRANIFGPYQSQALLASEKLQASIRACVLRESETRVEDTAVTVPAMDLWMGRHELLYSRIFNS